MTRSTPSVGVCSGGPSNLTSVAGSTVIIADPLVRVFSTSCHLPVDALGLPGPNGATTVSDSDTGPAGAR
jgi:hypothetical protein